MNIQPASILFLLLVLGAAFGLLGALIATPMAAFVKAIDEEFCLGHEPRGPDLDSRVEKILVHTFLPVARPGEPG